VHDAVNPDESEQKHQHSDAKTDQSEKAPKQLQDWFLPFACSDIYLTRPPQRERLWLGAVFCRTQKNHL